MMYEHPLFTVPNTHLASCGHFSLVLKLAGLVLLLRQIVCALTGHLQARNSNAATLNWNTILKIMRVLHFHDEDKHKCYQVACAQGLAHFTPRFCKCRPFFRQRSAEDV